VGAKFAAVKGVGKLGPAGHAALSCPGLQRTPYYQVLYTSS